MVDPGQVFAAINSHLARPLLVILSGPSGAGKSTLIRRFLARHEDFVASVSATTRPRRPGEEEGRDYFFLDEDTFRSRAAAGDFLEYAEVFASHWYGTPRTFVEDRLAAGTNVIMDIDVQGADQLRASRPDGVQILVVPPSAEVLEERLRGRGTEDEAALARRLATAAAEVARWPDYDWVLVNDDLEATETRLDGLVAAARCAPGSS